MAVVTYRSRSALVASAVCGLCLLASSPALGQTQIELSRKADLRFGYFGSRTERRDGSVGDRNDQFIARLRLGGEAKVGEAVSVGARLATRLGTDQDGLAFALRDYSPSPGGLSVGEATLDELYLRYAAGGRWSVQVGRMQTRADRMGLLGKSLDRKDSGNTSVTWTDGVRFQYTTAGKWNTDLILQRNAGPGPTNVSRPPLAFDDDGSRVAVFAAVGTRKRLGPLVQRGVAVTYMPDVLPDAAGGDGRRDYVALVGRLGVGTEPDAAGREYVLAGELGWAPITPTAAQMRLPSSSPDDEVSGLAFHVTATVYEVRPGHSVGAVYGRTGAGWLISPDYRPNNHLAEARYKWQVSSAAAFEARLRWRTDHRRLEGATHRQEDVDGYLRVTLTF